jgi:hypothetical protein
MLNELPFELLVHIFSFLDFEEKIENLYHINQKFRQIVLESEEVRIRKIGTIRFLHRINPKIFKIEHRYICYPILEIIVKKFTKLNTLSLKSSLPWNTDVSIISDFGLQLKILDLSNLFTIRDLTILIIAKNCLNLRYLNISNNYQLTNLSLRSISKNLKRLTCLNITRNPNFDIDQFPSLKNIKNLIYDNGKNEIDFINKID